MTPHRALLDINEPQMVVKHGRVYWSAAVIALIASAAASVIITRSQIEQLTRREEKIEAVQLNVATKTDVKAVGDRVDALYFLLLNKQEAGPPFRKVP